VTPFLIDTHCHIHFPPYDQDRGEVLSRMRETKMWAVTIGTSLETSRRGIAFADQTDDVWCTVGLHPEHLTNSYEDPNEGDVGERSVDRASLVQLVKTSKKVVAIGETGLDWYRMDVTSDEGKAKQEAAFQEHLAAAYETDLPLVIHCRDALTRLAEILQAEITAGRKPRGVVHSFTGTWEEAVPLLDLGFFIALNGIVTFPPKKTADPARSLDRVIERIPLDRLVLETDAPYLAPASQRGKRNEPAFVKEVADYIAKVRGVSVEEIAEKTTENAIKLFGLSV
jgi:TatD DNase family protein